MMHPATNHRVHCSCENSAVVELVVLVDISVSSIE